MFSFLSRYFKKRKEKETVKEPEKVTVSSSTGVDAIRYDPNLIRTLEAEHASLVALYGEIWSSGYIAKDYIKMSSLINQFMSDFRAHLLTENVRFYVYLEQAFAKDEFNLELVQGFRVDMNSIARTAINFCKKYSGKFIGEMHEKFEADYAAIGEVLSRRITLEEKSLYVLYQQHSLSGLKCRN